MLEFLCSFMEQAGFKVLLLTFHVWTQLSSKDVSFGSPPVRWMGLCRSAVLPCSRLLARFPPLHTAASVWEVLHPAWFVQGIVEDAHKAPLVWSIALGKSIVIQIIRTITKYSVCFCSHIVRSGINGEACTLLMGL